jgi:hypothetical protein
VACLALNLAILSHTITLLLLPVMMVAILGAIYLEDRKLHWPILAVFGLTAVLDALLYLLYLRPLLQGWNKGADWYTVGHSVLASVNMLGWVVSLLAPLGVGLIWFRERGQAWYWTVSGAGWVGAALVLPIVMSYHPAYVFPMALAAIVPAAYGVASTYELSRGVGKVAGAGLIGIAALSGLPSLASHFADGTRPDMRTAAGYVAAHCRPGDRVATYRLVVFRIYAKSCEPATDIPLGNEAIPKLTQLIREPGRLWIVVDSTRGGIPEGLREWLSEHARHQVRVQRRRFDYFENTMDVFLVSPLS